MESGCGVDGCGDGVFGGGEDVRGGCGDVCFCGVGVRF